MFRFLVFALLLSHRTAFGQNRTSKYPVILLAGYMGTQLKASVSYSDSMLCSIFSFFADVTIWLNVVNFIPLNKDCWFRFSRLVYDKAKQRSIEPPGVALRTQILGPTESVEYVAPFPLHMEMTKYYAGLINNLETLGYARGKSIKGAPYDWRKAPHEQSQFFGELKLLIEKTYEENNQKPVIIVGHSMGGLFGYIFLVQQSSSWKRKHIRALMSIATPWGGTFKYMYGYLFDDDYPADMFPIVRRAERTFSAMTFLLPNPRVYNDSTLISTPSFNYTANTYAKFFKDINNRRALDMYEDTKDLMGNFEHPEVDIYCIGGLGFRTRRGVIFQDDGLTTRTKTVFGDGDEFVNQESMSACERWKSNRNFNFVFKTIREDHMGMIKNRKAIEYLSKLITEIY